MTTRETRQPKKIRYTSAEWSVIVDRARRCGRSPARYVRESSLGAAPKVRRGREHDDMVHELGRIGTTLARLTAEPQEKRDNGRAPSFEAVLNELLAIVRRLG
jgi:hypothetical protein